MKRIVTKILILIALVWGGWWYVATSGLQRGINGWLDAQRQEGAEVELSGMSRGGFPMRISSTLENVNVTNPQAQTTLAIPSATLSTPIYWPGDAKLRLPADPITITAPEGTLVFSSDGIEAEVQLHPGTALELEAMTAESSAISLDLVEGRILSAQTVDAHIQQGDDPATYTVDLTAIGFAFGSILQEGLQLPLNWPATFEPILADMTITFDRPWDRSALNTDRPQPRTIKVEKLEAIYADLAVNIQADLTVDTAGVPSGSVGLQIRNWQQIFEMAVAATDVPPDWAPLVKSMLTSMSDMEGTLDLTVTLAGGEMRLGLFPIGPAPRIIIP